MLIGLFLLLVSMSICSASDEDCEALDGFCLSSNYCYSYWNKSVKCDYPDTKCCVPTEDGKLWHYDFERCRNGKGFCAKKDTVNCDVRWNGEKYGCPSPQKCCYRCRKRKKKNCKKAKGSCNKGACRKDYYEIPNGCRDSVCNCCAYCWTGIACSDAGGECLGPGHCNGEVLNITCETKPCECCRT